MAGGKESPRQRMINLMYLVLTAMLALNVSVEVLDAFDIVNEGIENTNISVDKKIEDYYNTFEQQYTKHPEKSAVYWAAAQKIRSKTDEIIAYIENDIKLQLLLKDQAVTEEELFNPIDEKNIVVINSDEIKNSKDSRTLIRVNTINLKERDKYDKPTAFMINENNAEHLRNKLDEYRQFVISAMKEAGIKNYDNNVGLRTDGKYYDKDGNEISWEVSNFERVILPAVIALLNEMIGEIQTIEYDAVTELFKSIGANDFKFNQLEAKVLPKTTFVFNGQDYEAEIYLAGKDTERQFEAKYAKGVSDFTKAAPGTAKTVKSENGVVTIKIPATQNGNQKYAGVIEMADPETGEMVPYPFDASFTVAPPSATVAPTKMNVMYRGLENPISVSAPGMASDNIQISVSNGEWRKGTSDGEYFVTPGSENITTVTTYATVDGKKTTLGSYDFRIKPVPLPTPKIAGKSSGKISKEMLEAAGAITVPLEGFDFEGYKYTVVSYDFKAYVGREFKTVRGNKGAKFTPEVLEYINNARRGQTFVFESISVKGPDGIEQPLDLYVNLDIE